MRQFIWVPTGHVTITKIIVIQKVSAAASEAGGGPKVAAEAGQLLDQVAETLIHVL